MNFANATLAPTPRRRWTDHRLMSLPDDGYKYELIDNDLVMSPVGLSHSLVCVRLVVLLDGWARDKKLGGVFDSSFGCRLAPDLMLSPDVSFISAVRLAQNTVSPEKFFPGAPDLVIEVLSPSDSMSAIESKVGMYFEHGSQMVWIVDPRKRTVTIQTRDHVEKFSRPSQVLSAPEILPGFKCKLVEIFAID